MIAARRAANVTDLLMYEDIEYTVQLQGLYLHVQEDVGPCHLREHGKIMSGWGGKSDYTMMCTYATGSTFHRINPETPGVTVRHAPQFTLYDVIDSHH